jgi:hypothetical protein
MTILLRIWEDDECHCDCSCVAARLMRTCFARRTGPAAAVAQLPATPLLTWPVPRRCRPFRPQLRCFSHLNCFPYPPLHPPFCRRSGPTAPTTGASGPHAALAAAATRLEVIQVSALSFLTGAQVNELKKTSEICFLCSSSNRCVASAWLDHGRMVELHSFVQFSSMPTMARPAAASTAAADER